MWILVNTECDVFIWRSLFIDSVIFVCTFIEGTAFVFVTDALNKLIITVFLLFW